MKRLIIISILFILLSVLNSNFIFAQNDNKKSRPVLYLYADKMPKFNYEGGLKEYIATNVKWPMNGQMDVDGTVLISFVVTKDGEVTDITLIKKVHEKCYSEVVNAFKTMPVWEPGELNSEKVDVKLYFSFDYFVTGKIEKK